MNNRNSKSTTTPRPRTVSRMSCLENMVDVEFVLSIFDTRPITENLASLRKLTFFGVLFSLAFAAGSILYFYYEDLQDVFNRTTTIKTVISIMTFAIEPALLLLFAVLLLFFPTESKPVTQCGKEYNADIGVVIPCHKCSNEIVGTLRACLKHFEEHQIYLVDNSNDPPDADLMREILEDEKFHHVNYIFQPIASKTLAQYCGAVAAKKYKSILLIDDDVRLPETIEFDQTLLVDTVKAISYSIRAVYPGDDERFCWLIQWQDFEYKLCDFVKQFQSKFSTVTFPHGAISLWDRDALINCLRNHDTVFYGEDVKTGLWLQESGLEMRHENRFLVPTDAPSTFQDYYKQRVRSWHIGEHFRAIDYFRALWTTKHSTIMGTIILKWFQLYYCIAVVLEWIRTPLLGICLWFGPITTALAILALSVVAFASLLIWNCLASTGRIGVKPQGWKVVCTFHFYKLFDQLLRFIGWGNTYICFLPNHKAKPTVIDLEQNFGAAHTVVSFDPRCPVWLFPSDAEYGHYFRHYDPSNPTAIHSGLIRQQQVFRTAVSFTEISPAEARLERILNSQVTRFELTEKEAKARKEVLEHLLRGNIPRLTGVVNLAKVFRKHPRIARVKDTTGNYLIHVACQCNVGSELITVIAKASPPNPINSDRETALHIACREGSEAEVVRWLLAEWPHAVKMRDRRGRLPLHYATQHPLSTVHTLFGENRRALRNRDVNGDYPLHMASVHHGTSDTAMYMIDKFSGATSRANKKGYLPLHLAAGDADNAPLVKRLIEIYPAATMRQNINGDTPLHIAVENHADTQLIARLIDTWPAVLQIRNTKDQIPIHVGCRSGCDLEVIERLTTADKEAALMLAADKDGNVPLHLSCSSEWLLPDVIFRLVQTCPSALGKKNKTGNLPIHLFCGASGTRCARSSRDEIGVLHVLQSHYPESCISLDQKRCTPLHLACSTEEPQLDIIVSLVRWYPEATQRRNYYNHTPLHTACTKHKCPEHVIKFLLEQSSWFLQSPNDDEMSTNVVSTKPVRTSLPRPPAEICTSENGVASHWDDNLGLDTEENETPAYSPRKEINDDETVSMGSFSIGVGADYASQVSVSESINTGSGKTTRIFHAINNKAWLKGFNGDTPLHLAIRHNLSLQVQKLLEAAIPHSLVVENDQGLTPYQLRVKLTKARRRQELSKGSTTFSVGCSNRILASTQ